MVTHTIQIQTDGNIDKKTRDTVSEESLDITTCEILLDRWETRILGYVVEQTEDEKDKTGELKLVKI